MSSKAQNSVPEINRLVIVGLGLIGSSLAIAAREQGLAKTVIGISRRTSTLELALELGVIDRACTSLEASKPIDAVSGTTWSCGVRHEPDANVVWEPD